MNRGLSNPVSVVPATVPPPWNKRHQLLRQAALAGYLGHCCPGIVGPVGPLLARTLRSRAARTFWLSSISSATFGPCSQPPAQNRHGLWARSLIFSLTVAVSRMASGAMLYYNAGKLRVSSELQDMRLQRMLGHLTTLLPDNPRSVLVIGFGATLRGAGDHGPSIRSPAEPPPAGS